MATLLDALDAAVNHHMAGRTDAAERNYRLILGVDPAQPDALHLLGVLRAQTGQTRPAVALLSRSVRVRPFAPQPWAHLAGALRANEQSEQAGMVARRALALDPTAADALDTLGAALHALARYPQAGDWLRRADALRPGHPETLLNLGTVLRDQQQFDEAERCFDLALARQPTNAAIHLARAVGRLVRGDLPGGWEGFEHRWRRLSTPPWMGEPLNGATILLHTEQGFGDAMQFVRYAPMVTQAGGRVVVETSPALFRLFQASLDPSIPVLVRGPEPPPHDRHCPLMSLPRAFGTNLTNIPSPIPYLTPERGDRNLWRDRLAEGRDGLRVGLVWAGNPRHRNDHNRSLPVAVLRPLLTIPGLRFISLQAGDARGALSALTPKGTVEDPMDRVRDFADTAAILANLDLLISVDTAVVHLAGAMGVPVWLLLPYAPDWRWLLNRADSPWYPSMRLFRQPRPGDWDTTLGTVTATLRAHARHAASHRTHPPPQPADPA